ncbi:hypothetical protein AGMMS49991_02540 [Spirochaetia bacterium]|nr:hypothetical protein AGMMS49991_02540 [Spirochaetia bacterium]
MTKKQAGVLTALSVVALILALLISRQLWFRVDLTEHKAYTISEVSRNLYTEIPDQVRITYYVSDRLVAVHPILGEITDLLREYAARSHGRIRLTVRDPVKANMVQVMEELGIEGFQIETVEQDQASVATVYTGILIEYLDKAEVMPLVASLNTLEYDLTSRIRALVRETGRDVGVLIGDAAKQWESDYPYLNQSMVQAGCKVRLIGPGEEISDTLPVLVVLGGAEELDEWALYRIDRYIQGGGKVLFALEAVSVNPQTGETRLMMDKGLLSMVSWYGATVQPSLVLDRSALNLNFLVRYPFWVAALAQNGNPDHPVSAGFDGADLFWVSPLELTPQKGVEGTILFSSTPDAWLMTKNFTINPNQSWAFNQEESESRGSKILAAALSGIFPSWFEGVSKPRREGSGETLPDLPAEGRPSRLVVIGDTDLASRYIEVNRSWRNLDFIIQALGWLSNDDDIIGIRNREGAVGRLDKIVDDQKRSAAMNFARSLNVVVIPLVVVALGLLIALRRRRSLNKGRG